MSRRLQQEDDREDEDDFEDDEETEDDEEDDGTHVIMTLFASN